MPWSNQPVVSPVVVVISGGSKAGLFVYNGTPAKGSLVGALTAPGTTSDPFGNSIPSSGVANFGTWNASGALTSHFGINNAGDTFLVNSSGKTVIHEASADGSIRFYNTSGEGAGNLISSVAPAAGTDSSGNNYVSGITTYNGTHYAQLQQTSLTLHDPANTADPFIQGSGSFLNLNSGTTAGSPNQGGLQIGAGGTPTVFLNLGTALELSTVTSPAAPAAGNTLLFSDANGFERMLPGLAGDTNVYQIGEVLVVSGGFTINLTSPQVIMSCPVGIGTYMIDVWMITSNTTAADAAGFAFTGPTAGVQLVDFTTISGTGPAVVNYTGTATYTQTFNGQGVAGNQQFRATGTVAFSAAGTLAITGKELVAGNTISVFAGARMRVRHVT